MGRRSRIDVLIEILNGALEGCSKTRLMYKCNLSYRSFNRYFKELLNAGLLVEVKQSSERTILYKTSEKGRKLMHILQRAKELITG